MKPIYCLVLITILLASCSSAPSANTVQTAIAQTQIAQATDTLPPKPTATLIPEPRPTNTQNYSRSNINGCVNISQGINIRSGPGLAFPKVGTLKYKDCGPILERSDDSLWGKTDTGWVYLNNLDLSGNIQNLQPASTLTNTAMLGWNKFEASGFEIWLPESYEGGDIENDLEVVISRMKALGPEFEQIVKNLEQNPSMVKLIAVDTNTGDTGFVTNINIGREQILSTTTFDMYLESMKKQLPSFWTIIDNNKVQLGQYEALRLVSRLDYSGQVMKQLQYTVKDNNTLWIITATTTLEEFDRLRNLFSVNMSQKYPSYFNK